MSEVRRRWWIYRCANLTRRWCGWSKGQALEYAKTLYETYVLDDADDWSPADALAEDMSYWGD